MTEMIERVAKVLFERTRDRVRAAGPGNAFLFKDSNWQALPLDVQQQWRERAADAIAAMREPTEAMVDAGYSAACQHDYGDTVPSLEIAAATWHAMTDVALGHTAPTAASTGIALTPQEIAQHALKSLKRNHVLK